MRLLLVEDKDSFRRLLVQALADSIWKVTAVGDPAEALAALQRQSFEVMVSDLRLPGFSGLELLKRAKRLHPGLRVVLMSAFGEAPDIVEAMRCGAEDFLPKPFDLDRFQFVLERLRAMVEAPPPNPREPWIANSPALRGLEEALVRAAETHAAVLFCGERGTGRSRSARRLHTLRHPDAPFLVMAAEALGIDGPGLDRLTLLKGGSLFLPELDLLPEASLPGLLRAMESPEGREVDWMGSARHLEHLPVRLRERLGVLCFAIPPLRERREDILPLFRTFLEETLRGQGRPTPVVERALERELLRREWHGNARELAWCTALAVRGQSGAVLGSLPHPQVQSGVPLSLPWPAPGPLEAMLSEVARNAEGQFLQRALAQASGDPSRAAQELGLTPRALALRLREHRIPLEEPR